MGRNQRINHRLVKIHRNYTVEETACLLRVHKNTVREWIKVGLPVTDDKRPILILGQELARFLQSRRQKMKRPCKPGQIYCVCCRAAKYPAGQMAEYRPSLSLLGSLMGICPDCHSIIHRLINSARLDEVKGELDVSFPPAPLHIGNKE